MASFYLVELVGRGNQLNDLEDFAQIHLENQLTQYIHTVAVHGDAKPAPSLTPLAPSVIGVDLGLRRAHMQGMGVLEGTGRRRAR